MKTLGLYVHIPFCIKKCNYCDFNSYGSLYHLEDEYFSALFSEIKEKAHLYKEFICDTVYIGGGTPSSVKTENIRKLIFILKDKFNIDKNAEITIECNPKTSGKEDFKEYVNAGINRVSIGLQSTFDSVLNTLGRVHTLSDFEECLNFARKAGFLNVSADLMFALPDQTLSMWKETLIKVLEYDLDHISCYGLKIESKTPFSKMKLNLPPEDEEADMYALATEILKENGYIHYEISNFSKKDKMSKHNLKYWSLMPYIGFGSGAYSSFMGKRYSNTKDINEYILNMGKDIKKEDEIILTEEELMSEFMFMGLRKTEGISEEEFFNMFKKDVFSVYKKPLEKYLKDGVLLRKNNRIYINEKMLYISNLILCDFV